MHLPSSLHLPRDICIRYLVVDGSYTRPNLTLLLCTEAQSRVWHDRGCINHQCHLASLSPYCPSITPWKFQGTIRLSYCENRSVITPVGVALYVHFLTRGRLKSHHQLTHPRCSQRSPLFSSPVYAWYLLTSPSTTPCGVVTVYGKEKRTASTHIHVSSTSSDLFLEGGLLCPVNSRSSISFCPNICTTPSNQRIFIIRPSIAGNVCELS